MGKFKQFLGKTEIEIAGEKLELKVDVEDIQKLMDMKKQKEKQFIYVKDILMGIMKQSYPQEPEEEVEAFIKQNAFEMTEELSIALKWTTREQLEKDKKRLLDLELKKEQSEKTQN